MYSPREILDRKSQWRRHLRGETETIGRQMRIGFAASFTVEPLLPFIGSELLGAEYVPTLTEAPYNQLFQACFDPQSAFELEDAEALCFLWRIEDFADKELNRWIEGDTGALVDVLSKLDDFQRALQTLERDFNRPIIVSLPPYPWTVESGLSDIGNPLSVGHFHRQIVLHWMALMSEMDTVHLLDLDALQRAYGMDASFDARKWYLYKQPYCDGFLLCIAQQFGRIINSIYAPPNKCIAVDCDNTLWGGIIGEEGLEGITLGDEFPGKAFVDLQKYLRHLKRQGALIALLSKNNEADVWEVFERHDAMVLDREDIAGWRINWDAKPGNLVQIAEEFNIAVDSFVFLDDNPFEVEQMKNALPEVTSVLLPEEPAEMLDCIKNLHLFDRARVSQEDRKRTAMMLQERDRTVASKSMSHGDFLKSLGLKVELFRASREHIVRVSQLIGKTNQFNLTTIRRSEEEVAALIASPDYEVFASKISDRYGDYGLTGVLIFNRMNEIWEIDTFLMSCRVLGRQVETAILGTLLGFASENSVRDVMGRYIPTPKNELVKELFPVHGFSQGAEQNAWVISTEARLTVPHHIGVTFTL